MLINCRKNNTCVYFLFRQAKENLEFENCTLAVFRRGSCLI